MLRVKIVQPPLVSWRSPAKSFAARRGSWLTPIMPPIASKKLANETLIQLYGIDISAVHLDLHLMAIIKAGGRARGRALAGGGLPHERKKGILNPAAFSGPAFFSPRASSAAAPSAILAGRGLSFDMLMTARHRRAHQYLLAASKSKSRYRDGGSASSSST